MRKKWNSRSFPGIAPTYVRLKQQSRRDGGERRKGSVRDDERMNEQGGWLVGWDRGLLLLGIAALFHESLMFSPSERNFQTCNTVSKVSGSALKCPPWPMLSIKPTDRPTQLKFSILVPYLEETLITYGAGIVGLWHYSYFPYCMALRKAVGRARRRR